MKEPIIKKSYTWLFSDKPDNVGSFYEVPEQERTRDKLFTIIAWWEARRIPYNIIVAISGFVSLILFYVFILASGELEPGEDAVEPLALIAAAFILPLAINIGWIFESFYYLLTKYLLFKEPKKVNRIPFSIGLIFSIALVFVPSVFWCGYLLAELFGWV